MANNLINIVRKIIDRSLQMNISLVGFFLLNMCMMIFISVFNSHRRIFGFSLVIVSLGLNMLPFTFTCLLLTVLSLYYQSQDKVVYKVIHLVILLEIVLLPDCYHMLMGESGS